MSDRMTAAMRRLLWAMAAGDVLVYQHDRPRNPFWRLKGSGEKVDQRTASRANDRAWLYGTVAQMGAGTEWREFIITAAGHLALLQGVTGEETVQ